MPFARFVVGDDLLGLAVVARGGIERDPHVDRRHGLAESIERRVSACHAHEHPARNAFLVRAEQLDGVGEIDQRPLVVPRAFEGEAAQIMRLAIGRCPPDEFVGHLDRLRIIGQPQIDVDRAMQGSDRRAAIEDELVEPVGGLPSITGLVQRQREIADALLVARLALEFFEAKPDVGIARGLCRQRAKSLIDCGKDFVGIFVQITRNCGSLRCKQQKAAVQYRLSILTPKYHFIVLYIGKCRGFQ